ncbi:MAG: ABC transporter ATP-binding protein/permease [Defluviitaleaceae bacterium]|nr:ABC transporter ATP-binding protein/permease [Defluviitaleaceae bacterium]
MKILLRIAKEAKKYRVLLIIAMFSTLSVTGLNLAAPMLLRDMIAIVSDGITENGLGRVGTIALMLLGLYLLRVVFRFMASYLAHVAAWNLVHEIRQKVYNTIQSFSMRFFHNKQTGELMTRVVADTDQFELMYAHIIPDMMTNFFTLIGVTTILFVINPQLALLTLIPVPFILLSGWIFTKKVRPKFRLLQKTRGEMNAQLQDNLSGIKEIQAFGQQERASGNFRDKNWHYISTMLKALKTSAVFHPTVEFITALGTVIVVGFGGFMAFHQGLPAADIVAFLLYLALFFAPITGLANLLEAASQALAGAERVIEILDEPENVVDAENAVDIGVAEGGINFESVDFAYIDDVVILNDISFQIKPGMMVAFVGATGVGKSTMTQLISRFYDPTAGRITIDGHDLKSITLNSLRKNVSVVLQDTFLFNGTIAQNIALSSPNASIEEIEAAAKIARIHNDIEAMPDGYQTQVGERGLRLSGGQKQRMAIARAVLCKAPVLILDEATASVDVETEMQIQQAISEIAGTRTIIAIAHRLSTIRNADVIHVFENGRIVQSGNHTELIAQEGVYRRMCKAQDSAVNTEIDEVRK